jgi:hypothetical protein
VTDQNNQDFATAEKAVRSLLDALEVDKVVYVDDANESVSIEDVIAAAITLDKASLLALFPGFGDNIPDDQDVLKKIIRDIWEGLDYKDQQERGQKIIVQQSDGSDEAHVSILRKIIPETKLVSLSPSQWNKEKKQLLEKSKSQRMLFLFDQDFSSTGGDPEGGIKIIASLLALGDAPSLICGLLTHTVTPETQPQQWADLSEKHSISKDRFVVIPKRYLSETPVLFAQTLKLTALSPDFAELKKKAKEIIEEATKAAADRVEKVSIYDLDHIVLRVSAEEGLWEPDMLFRLHAMFHRSESRQRAHDGGALEKIVAKLRAVSGILTSDHLQIPDSAWALQREELYEFDDYINKNHLPLDLGDIFEKTEGNSTKKYILLAQPCDLMVRDGKRRPDLHWIPLVEMASSDAATVADQDFIAHERQDIPQLLEEIQQLKKMLDDASSPNYSEEIPYFDESPSKKWFVKLKRVKFVHACLLDLCVFNQDGVAKLTINENPPSGIRPAWKKRHKILSGHWEKVVRMAETLAAMDGDSNTKKQIKNLLFNDDLFKGDFSNSDGVCITCNCRRVRRLSRARAMGLLMSYTATLGRPAYDRAFGRT